MALELIVHVQTQKLAKNNLLKGAFSSIPELTAAFPSTKFLTTNKEILEDIKMRFKKESAEQQALEQQEKKQQQQQEENAQPAHDENAMLDELAKASDASSVAEQQGSRDIGQVQTRSTFKKALDDEHKSLKEQLEHQKVAVLSIDASDKSGHDAATALLSNYKQKLQDFVDVNPVYQDDKSDGVIEVPQHELKASDGDVEASDSSDLLYESGNQKKFKKKASQDVEQEGNSKPLYNGFAMEDLGPSGSSPRNQDIRAAVNDFVCRAFMIERDTFSKSTFPRLKAGDSIDGVLFDLEFSNLPFW